jgi:hypothetical protein
MHVCGDQVHLLKAPILGFKQQHLCAATAEACKISTLSVQEDANTQQASVD